MYGMGNSLNISISAGIIIADAFEKYVATKVDDVGFHSLSL